MYDNKFSSYLKKKKPIIKRLVEELGKEFEYVSCLGTDVKGTLISADKKVINVRPSSVTESGFVVRVKGKETYFEYSINEISEKNFDSVKETIINEARKATDISAIDAPSFVDEPLVKNFVRKNEGSDHTSDELINELKTRIENSVKDEIINVNSSIECNNFSKMFISKNRELTQYYTWTNVRAFAFSKRGDKVQSGYSGKGYPSIDEAISNLDGIFEYATEVAKMLLDAKPAEPGVYTIITSPSITGLIVHEAFGHGVEMDMYVKDRAKSKEYIDKRVASELVNMHDGAGAVLSAATYFFDDDGVLAHDTKIIEKGILKRGISDLMSASELSQEPTGNGRRESYKRKSYTRMTNTFFEAGTSKLEDMIKSVDYGYMVCDTDNGMEDPKSWGIQCSAVYGREIRNGEFTGNIIAPVVMSGYVIDLLESIEAVSDGFEVIGSGSCGKGYKEWVRVSDGGACLKAKVKIG